MAPSAYLKKKLKTLCELEDCSKSKKHNIGKHLNHESLDLITDAAYNIVNAKPHNISKTRVNHLKPHKKILLYLANPKNSLENKRNKIVKQEGSGLISLLISIAIPLLSSLISKRK
jgi:hypothetical protein